MKIGGPAAPAGATASGGAASGGAASAKDAKLLKVSRQLEGAFVQQMYKSMRGTVQTGGMFDGGSGEEMFTGLMDEHVASDTPSKWQHGLSEAIYRQLRGAMHQQQATTAATTSDAAASAALTQVGTPVTE